jgi:LysR family glycine cleavage system transcriptional activator
MRRGRLPLTALRSFEAAGRHQSFSRAAEELFVSQAAVSRQIRELEVWLGRPLFERHHRRVELTDAGRQLLAQLTASFDAIDGQLQALQQTPGRRTLVVSVEPSFAALWLVPRLPLFRRDHPEIDIAIEADGRIADFRGHGPDLAIRYSNSATTWPRARSEWLADCIVAPVLSPALGGSRSAIAAPADLARYPLLHEERRSVWARWFDAAGVPNASPAGGSVFQDGALVVQAALGGHGVALVDLLLAREEIAAGRLIKPFDIALRLGAYWLVVPDGRSAGGPAGAFEAWIKACISR